jgi:hypothetical protein
MVEIEIINNHYGINISTFDYYKYLICCRFIDVASVNKIYSKGMKQLQKDFNLV